MHYSPNIAIALLDYMSVTSVFTIVKFKKDWTIFKLQLVLYKYNQYLHGYQKINVKKGAASKKRRPLFLSSTLDYCLINLCTVVLLVPIILIK